MTLNPLDSDAQLVLRAIRSDDEALRLLYERHIPAVFHFIARLAPADIEPDDVVQEAFVKAWKNLKRFNPKQSFKTWIFTIAKHTLYDHIKKKRPLAFSDLSQDDEDATEIEVKDSRPLADAILDEREGEERVQALLGTLQPPQRSVVVLHALEGLTFREIGEILAVPMETVKTRYRRALAVLAKLLSSDRPKNSLNSGK